MNRDITFPLPTFYRTEGVVGFQDFLHDNT